MNKAYSKNLIRSKNEYPRMVDKIVGVDLGRETKSLSRLSECGNMWRDYTGCNSEFVETMVGFRSLTDLSGEGNGDGGSDIYTFRTYRGGLALTNIACRFGKALTIFLDDGSGKLVTKYNATITRSASPVSYINIQLGKKIIGVSIINAATGRGDDVGFTVNISVGTAVIAVGSDKLGVDVGETASAVITAMECVEVKRTIDGVETALFLEDEKTPFFYLSSKLYFINGGNYYEYDVGFDELRVINGENGYIPTTMIDVSNDGTVKPIEYEQRNTLSDYFINRFIGDGTTTEFNLSEYALEEVSEVKVYGITKTVGTDYTVDLNKGKVTFATAPAAPGSVSGVFATDDFENATVYTGTASALGNAFDFYRTVSFNTFTGKYSFDDSISVGDVVTAFVEDSTSVFYFNRHGVPCKVYEYYENDRLKMAFRYKKPVITGTGASYDDDYAGIEVKAKKAVMWTEFEKGSAIAQKQTPMSTLVSGCKIAVMFDDRIFLSGNLDYPNYVFYCGRSNDTGLVEPTYFGVLNYMRDGNENSPVTGMLPMSNILAVLKGSAFLDSDIYLHSISTINDTSPLSVVYPSVKGVSGLGCLGCCTNFLDDPVFLSEMGLEAISSEKINLERTIQHRSSYVDMKLCGEELDKCSVCEYAGYLWILAPSGNVYLADSRATSSFSGSIQYEWFLLNDIGVYDGQYEEYIYSDENEFVGRTALINGTTYNICDPRHVKKEGDLGYSEYLNYGIVGETANEPEDDGTEPLNRVLSGTISDEIGTFNFVLINNDTGVSAYVVTPNGGYTGGVFSPAKCIASTKDNVYFITGSGKLCCFNFDMRRADKTFPFSAYSFNKRREVSYITTQPDNCGLAYLTKSTINKSLVIRTRNMEGSAVKVFVSTDSESPKFIDRIYTREPNFDNFDFSGANFGKYIFAIHENEKRWVEKQYAFVSDDYCMPMAISDYSFRYIIGGKIKT